MFEKVWEAAMRENQPTLYQSLIQSGQLAQEMAKFERQATAAFETALKQMETMYPAPKDETTLQRGGRLGMLAEMARDQVLADLLPQAEPSEPMPSDSTTDSPMMI
jgi:hypothetical protein